MAELIWHNKATSVLSLSSHYTNSPLEPSQSAHQFHTYKQYIPSIPENTLSHSLPAWNNRLIQGCNEYILPALQTELIGKIDLIYIDPPFMTGRTFKTGDQIDYIDNWKNDLDAYLNWLYTILKNLYLLFALDGSFYLHLDWRVAHYAKIMLDEIFNAHPTSNKSNFRNEIIWHYQSGGRSKRYYARKHDTIFFYTKSNNYCFHSERVAQQRGTAKRNHMRKTVGPDGLIAWTIQTGGRTYTYDEHTLLSQCDVWGDISHLHQKAPERTGYATQKPEALLERIILASSEENDLILDCFCGSGVTPTVAERLGRRWIACDQSETAITISYQRLARQQPKNPFILQHSIPTTDQTFIK